MISPSVVEPDLRGADPVELARARARVKLASVAPLAGEGLLVSADTIVVLGDDVLGKPDGPEDARVMLRRLAGGTHDVLTAVAVCDTVRARGLVEVERTRVTLRAMNDVEIAWYVNTGEPMDKAGAYAAQGLGALFITEFQGCFYNVVGLPLVRLASMTARLGQPLLSFCPPGYRVREPSGSSLDSS